MNKEQLTEKLNEMFKEELGYKPEFEVLHTGEGIYPFRKVATLKFRNRIEYFEIGVISKHFDNNPWIETYDEEYLVLIFCYDEKALE